VGKTLVTVGVLLGAAAEVLGRPDLTAAGNFLAGAYATETAALAVVAVIVWALILVTVAAICVHAVRDALGHARGRRHRLGRAVLIALGGLALLAGGVYRHSTPAYSVCCGSLQEARDLAR